MLFLVTLFALSALVCSQQGNSAHLDGAVPAATDYAIDQVITTWNAASPNSHVLPRFEYANGRLHVPDDGRYYVYMQLYFNSRPHDNNNRVALFADNRLLLMIHMDMSPGQENTGFAGGVFKLKRGEKIYVKVIGYNTKMWVGPNHSYFGAYLI